MNKMVWLLITGKNGLEWFVGGFDNFWYAMAAFMACNCITAVLAAIVKQKMSLKSGLNEIAKKICIIIMIGIANIIDTLVLKNGSAVRSIVMMWYIVYEGKGCVENAEGIGLPISGKIKEILKRMGDETWGE